MIGDRKIQLREWQQTEPGDSIRATMFGITESTFEYCCECGQPTGRAGQHDGSIYIYYPDKKVGPICEECRNKHWVCEECGEGVYPEKVTFDERHEGCGGVCS